MWEIKSLELGDRGSGCREKWDSEETLSGSLNHSLRSWKVEKIKIKIIKKKKMETGF